MEMDLTVAAVHRVGPSGGAGGGGSLWMVPLLMCQ